MNNVFFLCQIVISRMNIGLIACVQKTIVIWWCTSEQTCCTPLILVIYEICIEIKIIPYLTFIQSWRWIKVNFIKVYLIKPVTDSIILISPYSKWKWHNWNKTLVKENIQFTPLHQHKYELNVPWLWPEQPVISYPYQFRYNAVPNTFFICKPQDHDIYSHQSYF